jgi:hypothetical protein
MDVWVIFLHPVHKTNFEVLIGRSHLNYHHRFVSPSNRVSRNLFIEGRPQTFFLAFLEQFVETGCLAKIYTFY